MRARLIERGGKDAETREYPLTQPEFLMGRGADCDLRLRSSSMSRHHCIIRTGPDGVTLVDLGSSNGTYLNGERVRSQAALKTGDEVRLDQYLFLVDLGDQGDVERVAGRPSLSTPTLKLDAPPPEKTNT
jgi:pSer/pThr/pTyr-binding forkhead associated (FHA) protein